MNERKWRTEIYNKRLWHEERASIKENNNRENILLTSGLWITEAEFDEFKKEMVALEDKYVNLSLKNRKNIHSNAFRVSVLVNMIPKWEPGLFTDVRAQSD